MEFEALEDEANAIHGDLWEQLNAGGQVNWARFHIQTSQCSHMSNSSCLFKPQPVLNKLTK